MCSTQPTSIKILFVCLFFSFVFVAQLSSQTRLIGKIIEKDSKLAVPFASVVYQKHSLQKGVIADIHGRFEIDESDISSLTVSCVGYKQNKVQLSSKDRSAIVVVELETAEQEINGVVVTPANNPAIRIIRNVLDNKTRNNFENYEKYGYRCYVKIMVDVKLSDNASSQDSLKMYKNGHLTKQAPFISECVMSVSKQNKHVENKIIAQKTSGFKDPLFVQSFATMFHHTLSFYNNSISLFAIPFNDDKSASEYLSPVSDGCLSAYSFELDGSYTDASDTVFVISFHPKKGTKFNGLKGQLFISSNAYAIQHIVVEPVDKGLINFKFRQDYKFTDNKWFPTKLDEEIGLVAMRVSKKANAYPVYLITSNIDSVRYNPDTHNRKLNLEKVYLDEASLKNSAKILADARPDSLTLREKNTYHILDSIGNKKHYDRLTKLFLGCMVERIPVGWLDMDINSLYNYNKYEGSRWGMGLYTNDGVSKTLSLGGFAGYGFKDQKMKYGGQLVVDLNKYREWQLKLSYQHNLKEVGADLSNNQSLLSLNNYLRTYMGSRYDECVEQKAELGFRPFRFLKVTTSLSLKDLNPTYTYAYKGVPLTNYKADEVQVSVRYAYGEELETFGGQRVVNFEGNPVFNLTYKRGISLFNKNSYKYNRIEATIDFTAYNGRIGQSTFRLASGFIDRSLPYGLLFTGEGSKDSDIPLLINNSFQALKPYEFLSDKYVRLFYSHNFGSLLINTKRFKPQFVIVQNSGWGGLRSASDHEIDFKTPDKIYLESGLIINNIVKIKYMNLFYFNLGVGGFYRYGSYGLANSSDNLALKLAMSVSLK